MRGMIRRILTVTIALSIALVGYQPARAMMLAVGPVVVETAAAAQPMAMPDGPADMQGHDCCDEDGKARKSCTWDARCAAMCHVNIGIEPVIALPPFTLDPSGSHAMVEPQWLAPRSPGSPLRPPIV